MGELLPSEPSCYATNPRAWFAVQRDLDRHAVRALMLCEQRLTVVVCMHQPSCHLSFGRYIIEMAANNGVNFCSYCSRDGRRAAIRQLIDSLPNNPSSISPSGVRSILAVLLSSTAASDVSIVFGKHQYFLTLVDGATVVQVRSFRLVVSNCSEWFSSVKWIVIRLTNEVHKVRFATWKH